MQQSIPQAFLKLYEYIHQSGRQIIFTRFLAYAYSP